MTSSDFPNRETFVKREEFCITLTKLNRTCHSEKEVFLVAKFPTVCKNIKSFSEKIRMELNVSICEDMRWDHVRRWGFRRNDEEMRNLEDDIFQYAKKNLAVVNVYIKDPVVTRIMRDQKIPVIAFVANTGGLLGLCMGFSLVSLFEILYHLLGSVSRWWQQQQQQQSGRPENPVQLENKDFQATTTAVDSRSNGINPSPSFGLTELEGSTSAAGTAGNDAVLQSEENRRRLDNNSSSGIRERLL